MAKTIECDSELGIVIGLIDSMITAAKMLEERRKQPMHALGEPEALEAMRDFLSIPTVMLMVMACQGVSTPEKIRRYVQMDDLEKMMAGVKA